MAAYYMGYFPMPDDSHGAINWYRPDPRGVIPLNGFHVSRTLKKTIRKNEFTVSYDKKFTAVMEGCADRENTWINDDFIKEYSKLHQGGHAHSVEIWSGEKMVGGCYGVSLGDAFFAESMFHYQRDASKVSLYYLVKSLLEAGFILLECQFLTPHLESLGAVGIKDSEYMDLLSVAVKNSCVSMAVNGKVELGNYSKSQCGACRLF